jgi:chromosome partitioning protein
MMVISERINSSIKELAKMKTVVVWNPKGGCGKSTATVHLALAAEILGDGPVLICDVDEQGTTADWHNFRQNLKLKGPGYAPLTVAKLKTQIADFSAAGATYLFIDMKAGVGPNDDAILAQADRVLIPLNPKPADMLAMRKKMPAVRKAGKPFTFLLSRCRHNLRTNASTSAALGVLGHVLPTLMYEREIYSDTFGHGMTTFELEPNGAASNEARAVWTDFKQQLESGN